MKFQLVPLALAGSLVTSLSSTASAITFGDYPATMCVPARPATTTIVFGGGYALNEGTRTESLRCPVPRIDDYGASKVSVDVYVGYQYNKKRKGGDRHHCSLSTVTAYDESTEYDSVSYYGADRKRLTIETTSPASKYLAFSYIVCRLPPQGKLWAYGVAEHPNRPK